MNEDDYVNRDTIESGHHIETSQNVSKNANDRVRVIHRAKE